MRRLLDRIMRLFISPDDPVWHCEVYRTKQSCAHVDGPLCDFPKCSMLQEHRRNHLK